MHSDFAPDRLQNARLDQIVALDDGLSQGYTSNASI